MYRLRSSRKVKLSSQCANSGEPHVLLSWERWYVYHGTYTSTTFSTASQGDVGGGGGLGLDVGAQVDNPQPDDVHEYPTCTARQSPLHPSPDTELPSSHASLPARIASPHVVEHTLGSAVLHVYPHSTVHADEHPSSDTVLP